MSMKNYNATLIDQQTQMARLYPKRLFKHMGAYSVSSQIGVGTGFL